MDEALGRFQEIQEGAELPLVDLPDLPLGEVQDPADAGADQIGPRGGDDHGAAVSLTSIEPGDRILAISQIIALTGLSRTTIWRLRRRNEFPPLFHLSPGRIGGSERAVLSWLNANLLEVDEAHQRRPGYAENSLQHSPRQPSAGSPAPPGLARQSVSRGKRRGRDSGVEQ